MRLKNIIKRALGVLGLAVLIISCEDEFGSVGTEIVGEVNFETELAQDFGTVAYSRNYADGSQFNGVQTNVVQIGALGHYNDPIYGPTTASFLSQVRLSRFDPDFGNDTVIDSVTFSLSYFSTLEEVDEDGNNVYVLDSIFNNTGSMNLSVFRSNFFLNSLDPATGFEDPAIYFSNQSDEFTGIEGDLLFEIQDFTPSAEEIVLTVPMEDEDGNITDEFEESERLAPQLRLVFDKNDPDDMAVIDYWTETIINQEGQPTLLNPNGFNDYFRGLYLRAESPNGTGSFFLFELDQLNIEIFYSFTGEGGTDTDDDGFIIPDGTGELAIELDGVRTIQYENDFSGSPIGAVAFNDSQNTEVGEEELFLKGGDGAIVLVDLFGPNEAEGINIQLDRLRTCSNIIINEANLTFFVDQEALGEAGTGVLEPERIFIYDFDNNRTLIDGEIDGTTGSSGPLNTRVNHLGRLTREVENDLSSDGVSYRLRLTQHVNNIIKNDSTNVRLAIGVAQNVTEQGTALIGGTGSLQEGLRIPLTSVISPEGTILHGSTSTDEEKRLRLRIFYTITEEIDPNSPCGIALGLN